MEYFFDEIPFMGYVKNVNRHFASQYSQCPFCGVDFDVLGKKETFDQDMKVALLSVKLDVRTSIFVFDCAVSYKQVYLHPPLNPKISSLFCSGS